MKPADGADGVVSLGPSDTAELKARVFGPVLLPGDDKFDDELSGFELSVTHQPSVIIGATGPADVAAAVRFAAERRLPVAVQATGHGASVPTTGVFISTRRMTGVWIDPARRAALIDAGVRWDRVIHEASMYSLAPLSGSAPFLGAVSYVLGGGIGLLSRRYGYAADHVLGFNLVTADGESRRVSAHEYPDLFWGVRGSKGNLGIVTSIEVSLFPVDRLYGGGLFFAGESTKEVLSTYFDWVGSAPDELSSSVFLMRYPDVDAVPEPLRDRFVVHIRLSYLGDPTEAERLFRPLRAAGPILMDTLAGIPYRESGVIHADPPDPVASHSKVVMLRRLNAEAADVIVKLAGPEANAPFGFELRHLGGALAQPAESPSAIGRFPDAVFSAYIGSVVEPGQSAAINTAQQQMLDALQPWSTGIVTLNFLAGANTSVATVRTAYTEHDYVRLRELKAQYDPDNMFRFNPNIPPAE